MATVIQHKTMKYLNIYSDGAFECFFEFDTKADMEDYCLYFHGELPEYEGSDVANLYI